MKTRSTLGFLGTAVLTGGIALASVQGCQSNTATGTGASPTSSPAASSSSSGMGAVTIQQITDPMATGHVGPGTPVTLHGAVAMTHKFFISKSKSSGSCLWGAFFTAPGISVTAPYTGVLVIDYGDNAMGVDGGTAYCPVPQAGQHSGGILSDELQPGDVVTLSGQTDAYVPSTCSAADAGVGYTNVPAVQVTKLTAFNIDSHGAPLPTPAKLSATDVLTLAGGSDKTWLEKWGNVLVEADGVQVESQAGALTDKYGHMILDAGTNGIEVGDSIYYVGYVKYTDACYNGPTYVTPLPFTLNFVRGFVYLDYCNWSIAPRNKCDDLGPASVDCDLDGGADASPLTYCTHEPEGYIPGDGGTTDSGG